MYANPLLEPVALASAGGTLILFLLWEVFEGSRSGVHWHVRRRRSAGVRQIQLCFDLIWIGSSVSIQLVTSLERSKSAVFVSIAIIVFACALAFMHFGKGLNLLRSGNSPL